MCVRTRALKEGKPLEKPPKTGESCLLVKPSNAFYKTAAPCFSAELFPELLGDSGLPGFSLLCP